MKFSNIFPIFVLSFYLLSACGSTITVWEKDTAPSIKQEEVTASGKSVAPADSGAISPVKNWSGSLESLTGAEDPEVKAIMNDLDTMFEDVASEK